MKMIQPVHMDFEWFSRIVGVKLKCVEKAVWEINTKGVVNGQLMWP